MFSNLPDNLQSSAQVEPSATWIFPLTQTVSGKGGTALPTTANSAISTNLPQNLSNNQSFNSF